MRRAVLMGLALRAFSGLKPLAAIIATVIAVSLRARKSILAALGFSLLSLLLQFLLAPSIAIEYALRVYVLVITLGGAMYTIEPEELLCVLLRLRIPRSLALIAFLSQSYIRRLANRSIDAKLVAEWKYSGFIDRLRGMLLGMVYFVVEESVALAEVIEAYLKNPIKPPKGYRLELLAFSLVASLPFFL